MSLLEQVTKGKLKQPVLALCYGPDGVGKSSLGASMPAPIFLGTEKGTAFLDVARFPSIANFKQVLQALDELTTAKHEFQSLVVDSLDWLEPVVWEQVCIDNNWKHMEDPGFGKAYVLANRYWQDMMGRLTKLRESRGMNILLIAHSQVKLAKDPQNQTEYDRYQLKLNEKAAALWREYTDAVLFANFEVFTKEQKGKTKAFGDGARYLYTERRPGFDAKNRYGLPFQIPLDWDAFMDAYLSEQPEDPETILSHIEELLSNVRDAAVKTKVEESLKLVGKDVAQLERIQNKLRALVA